MAKKKVSKASRAASRALKGEQAAVGKGLNEDSLASFRTAKTIRFLDKPIGPGLKLTWKAILLFLLFCLMLDVGLYLIFQLGFDTCYAALCMIEDGFF